MPHPNLRLTLLCLAAALPGCDRRPASALAPGEHTSTYEVRGVIHKLKPGSGTAVIAHDAIAGYMDAMTMEFTAADPRDLAALAPGDVVSFRLSVSDARSWIDQVRKTGTAPISADADPAASPAPGTPLPDCALVDSRGAALRLSDFKGRAFAFTFIFTRCPLPDFCPRMNANFAAAQRALGSDANWHLLSISLDPDYDTPPRLAEYAARYQPDPARWTFATGSREEIEKLGAVFGLKVARTGALPDHNLRTIVVDPAGRIQRVFTGNEWTPEELAAELKRAMAP